MREITARFLVVLMFMAGATGISYAQGGEPSFDGKPLSVWIHSLRDRDVRNMEQAFDAIKALGPRASAAIPELIRIFDQPFESIRVGIDDDEVILKKLCDIQLRADAIDSLGAIGPAAASAATPLITWALTKRVIPSELRTARDYRAFVDLVSLDILERIRVVTVISGFRLEAAPAIRVLIHSKLSDERKLGVAILQANALLVAAELLKTSDCDARKLGLSLLVDMWSVVPTDHLEDLKEISACAVATK